LLHKTKISYILKRREYDPRNPLIFVQDLREKNAIAHPTRNGLIWWMSGSNREDLDIDGS
jgi:hypothetical protein